MDGRIAHLRSHYRLAGAQVAAPAIASRLDRVLREEAMRSCAEALDSVLAGDESVYVLRRVRVKTSFVLSDEATDAGIGKRWGSHLATAVIRAIARGEDAADNFVRFENQADYVASFLVALLQGTEHKQWFFSAFDYAETLDRKSAIRRVLLDNISHASATLARVHHYGKLDSLLAMLDTETKQALWSPESELRDDLEISRSLFTTALQLLQRMEAWTAPSKNADELFAAYWEADPPFADWRDPRSLAESVLEVVRYFVAYGYLSAPEDVSELSRRLGEALEGFEWLDREWLRSSVLELFQRRNPIAASDSIAASDPIGLRHPSTVLDPITAPHPSTAPDPIAAPDPITARDLPLRMSSGRATPRQRELLAAIAGAVGDTNVVNGDSLTASLKMLALLVNHAPGWTEDAAAKVMIENVLAVRAAMQSSSSPGEFLKQLRRRDVESALRLLSLDARAGSGDACRAVAALGEPAVELLETLSKSEAKGLVDGVESNCAGLSLLVRAMLDARLHAFADEDAFPLESEWPAVVMLFVLVAHRVAGDDTFVDGRLERGLCLLAGIDPPPTSDDLGAVWRAAETADYSNFQEALLRIAEGQRLIDPEDNTASVIADCEDLEQGKTGNPNLDQTIAMVTGLLLRMWARWLNGFSASTISFLVENFIRRSGRLYVEKDTLLIELDQRPLDVVMEMAGYFADLERVPWLPGKRIKFLRKGS